MPMSRNADLVGAAPCGGPECGPTRSTRDGWWNDELVHSPPGKVAVERWQAIPERFPAVDIDAYVVMPDHIHGIVFCGTAPDDEARRATTGDVVRWFKSSVQAAYRHGVRRLGWSAYDRHLWQRDYHDRIIRTADEFAQYHRYIEGNPGRWWERHRPKDITIPPQQQNP